jgi:hypothetical protein
MVTIQMNGRSISPTCKMQLEIFNVNTVHITDHLHFNFRHILRDLKQGLLKNPIVRNVCMEYAKYRPRPFIKGIGLAF